MVNSTMQTDINLPTSLSTKEFSVAPPTLPWSSLLVLTRTSYSTPTKKLLTLKNSISNVLRLQKNSLPEMSERRNPCQANKILIFKLTSLSLS